MPRGVFPRTIIPVHVRFARYVRKTATCWLWTGAVMNTGYGELQNGKGRIELTHRLAWKFAYGPIPKGRWVLHHCDVQRCVRPSHLFLGTQVDNMRDASKKGRTSRGMRRNGVKLTDQAVRAIRRAYARGGVTMRTLGDKYGVWDSVISNVVHRKAWKHIA